MNVKNSQENNDFINLKNNEELVKKHYKYWIKFKDELFQYLLEIIKLEKIKMFYCNNCQQGKDVDDLNIYDLFLDLLLIRSMLRQKQLAILLLNYVTNVMKWMMLLIHILKYFKTIFYVFIVKNYFIKMMSTCYLIIIIVHENVCANIWIKQLKRENKLWKQKFWLIIND
ncbi:hypothetical protein SCITRI_00459 [Spiroplasma citri]|nr:hypothetical protein SCITRI_00459 [Spiroplasma citri]